MGVLNIFLCVYIQSIQLVNSLQTIPNCLQRYAINESHFQDGGKKTLFANKLLEKTFRFLDVIFIKRTYSLGFGLFVTQIFRSG